MGWKGRGGGPWPGRGPFSYLPPWQRPGWLYGRGACWWFLAPHLKATVPQASPTVSPTAVPPVVPTMPFAPTFTKEQERQLLEQHVKTLEAQVETVMKRLEELKSGE